MTTMNRFAPALHEAVRELDLPRRVRARILLEMGSDLEGLFAHYRETGLSEGEAAQRAEEMVLGSGAMLNRLAAMHRSPLADWSSSIGRRLGNGGDVALLTLGVAPALAGAAWVAIPQLLGNPASPFIWAMVLVGAGILGIAVSKVRSLFLKRRASWRDLRAGLSYLLLIAAVGPAIGALALALGFHALATAPLGTSADPATELWLWNAIARDGALLVMGLLLGIGAALLWFVLINRAATLEEIEVVELLGNEPSPAPGRSRADVIHIDNRRQSWLRHF